MTKTLRLILGDQLNIRHSWFRQPNPEVTFTMMEVREEATYVTHHIQKLLAFFAAMRAFRDQLVERGHRVLYYPLDSPENLQDVCRNIESLMKSGDFSRFEYMQPDEYRLDRALAALCKKLGKPSSAVDTAHFLTPRLFVETFFAGKKTFRMESFYRQMRKEFGILMETGGRPQGGRWNFDAENRKKYDGRVPVPAGRFFSRDVSGLRRMIEQQQIPFLGTVDAAAFTWPTTRRQCLAVLDDFLENGLRHFGTYQDAMDSRHPFLFHSRLSFALNTKMINPLEVVSKSIEYWQRHPETIGLAQIEGFVRQIIGWREYMRGIYWAKMPDFKHLNFLEHHLPLPRFYWTGQTRMACMHNVITGSLNRAYAHHIQRLMVTGNFAMLAGVDPDEVDRWYLGIYIDALEWVEITNTRGMSQFADGGIVGSKPYAGSANYINKMSNYCKSCHYAHGKRYGSGACPFNCLYWHFYYRHRSRLANNPRIAMAYRLLDQMEDRERKAICAQAERYRRRLDRL